MYSDITADDFISQLVNDGLSTETWLDSRFASDFILLSEFSELEGPKPIFTIPDELTMKFNLNMFAVRVMSVDCISIMQTTDLSTFNIAGDIQVVLTEVSEGAYAFVHHFVLYDIRARGFVRPYCLAYVTRSYAALMKIFESLRHYFSIVSSLFHFGNALNFMNDLILRCQHLSRLNDVLSDKYCSICVDEKILTESQKKSIGEYNTEESIMQMKELYKIFREYLDRDVFVENRELFKYKFNEAVTRNFPTFHPNVDASCVEDTSRSQQRFNAFFERDDDYYPDIFLPSTSSYEIPADVISSILGKKYDKPMRHLNELCDVTFKAALHTLKYILANHSRDNVIFTASQFSLPCSVIGALNASCKPEETSNVLRCQCCSKDTSLLPHSSLKELLKTSGGLGKKLEFDPSNSAGRKKGNVFDGIGNSFLSLMTVTSIENPISNAVPVLSPSRSGSYLNISSAVQSPSGSLDDCHFYSSGSFKDIAVTNSSDVSRRTSNSGSPVESNFDQISLSPSVLNVSLKEKCGIDYFDTSRCAQVSMLALKKKYSFLAHAVYSILIGRPLIITGEEKNKRKVRNLVHGFANFLPHKDKFRKVIPWMNGPLTLKHVSFTLIGLLKSSKVKTVQNSLKPYVSILDYEEETLLAPHYVGKFLNDMFNVSATFSTDASYRRFLLQMFTELSSKVFVHFVIFYLKAGKYIISTNYGVSMHSDIRTLQRREIVGDESIILALVQNMKEEIMEKFVSSFSCLLDGTYSDIADRVGGKLRKTMKLSNLRSSLFPNSLKKKR